MTSATLRTPALAALRNDGYPALAAPTPDKPWRDYRAADVSMSTLSVAEQRLVRAVFITMIGCIVAQKLATPGLNVQFGVFFVTGFTIWGFLRRYLEIDAIRLFGFAVVNIAILTVTLAAHAEEAFSLPSLMLLIFLHLPFVFKANVRRDVYVAIIRQLQKIALFIAAMVFLQWGEQAVGLRMTNLEDYVPTDWLFHFYNYVQKVHFFSPWYKPNGIFMLEASHTSQLFAIALVAEFCVLKRTWVLFILFVALVMTYAGTGFIMLVLSAPFLIGYLSRRTVLAGLAILPVVLLLAWQLGFLENALGRTAEIAQPGTSGSGRLIAPYLILGRTLSHIPSSILYGIGPGVMNPFYSSITDMLNPVAKIVTEYGLPLGLLWLVWFHFCTFTARVPAAITAVVLAQYDVTGGGLLVPVQTYYCLLITAMIVPSRPGGQGSAASPTGPPRRVAASQQIG
jgi:hypothetical protein